LDGAAVTRINLGVNPSELCDQMLLASYRELPRMNAFALKRLEKYDGAGPCPELPTLGTGHMAYFLPYGIWLKDHYTEIIRELLGRGFKPQYTLWRYPEKLSQDFMPWEHKHDFAPLLKCRINQQLKAMKRSPTWTNRSKPEWAITDNCFKENK
jgi:hypothetical protein